MLQSKEYIYKYYIYLTRTFEVVFSSVFMNKGIDKSSGVVNIKVENITYLLLKLIYIELKFTIFHLNYTINLLLYKRYNWNYVCLYFMIILVCK